jgi:branched-chain amino acid aminotransferase
MSVIQILKDWGYNMNERMVSMEEVTEGYKNGNLVELFGTGTAAVISSVGRLKYKDLDMRWSDSDAGELAEKLYREITDIQYGRKEDKYGWVTYLD